MRLLPIAVLLAASAIFAEDSDPNVPEVIIKKGEPRVERVKDDNGVVTEKTFDANGNMISKTVGAGTPKVAKWLYSFDMYGRVVSEVDPKGNKTGYFYKDASSREPSKICLPDGTIKEK